MKKLIPLFVVLFVLPSFAHAPQFTASYSVTFTIAGTTQAQANSRRAALLVDFAKGKGLDIYVPGTTTIDAAKVAPAVDAYFKTEFKAAVKAQREREAAAAAIIGVGTQVDTEVP